MEKKQSLAGIGPYFIIFSIIASVIVIYIGYNFVILPKFILFSQNINYIVGTALVVIGLPFYFIPIFTLPKYIKDGKLYTSGIYSIVRHPVYASWILFFIPGITFFNGFLLGFLIPILMYIIFRLLIKKEESYLEEKFGKAYLDYKQRVNSIFPKLNI